MTIILNYELPNQNIYPSRRRWKATCSCGRVWEARLDHLKRPNANCGCKNKGSLKHGHTAYGNKYRDLHSQWRGMFKRAKQRENCEVGGDWLNYDKFLKAAIKAGWTQDNRLWVCRKEDMGNYTEENTYFGTRSDNTKDTWEYGGRSCANNWNGNKNA